MDIKQWIEACHNTAKEKGWWDLERFDGELIALMHSELFEVLEVMCNDLGKEHVAEELADCCIRIFDYCGARGLDLEDALKKKAEKNRSRPYRHGKKF